METTPSAATGDIAACKAAFAAYRDVLASLGAGAPPASLPGFERLTGESGAGLDAAGARARLVGATFRPDVMRGFLEVEWPAVAAAMRKAPKARGRVLAWRGGYGAEAALDAFAATGDAGFLAPAAAFAEAALTGRDCDLGIRDDFHGIEMPAWSSTNLRRGRVVAHVTHFGRIMGPVLRLARLAADRPGLALPDGLPGRAAAAFEAGLAAFEVDRRPIPGGGGHWYWRPLQNKWEATNHMHILGLPLLDAWRLTGEDRYRARAQEIMEIFSRGLDFHDDGTVAWRYAPCFWRPGLAHRIRALYDRHRPEDHRSEPFWKGSLTVPFIAAAEREGLEMPAGLVDAVIRNFLDHAVTGAGVLRDVHWKGSPRFAPDRDRLDGARANKANSLSGWLAFADRAPEIETRLAGLVRDRPDLFPKGWFGAPNIARGYARGLAAAREERR